MGKGTFRIRSGFELLNQAQSKLSEHIQVLLDGTIYDTAEVFRKMDIKNPVHGFHGPFHPGMMKQLQCGKIGPSVKSCVSEIRQSQVWCRENSTECGLEPLLTHHPGGPDGMCAGGVNAVRFAGIF